MAALAINKIVDAGTKPTFGAANLTDTAVIGNGTNSYVHYKNTDTNVKTITVAVPGTTSYGDTPTQHVVTLPANTGEVLIPLRRAYDDGTGNATLTVSGTGGVTGVTNALIVLG